MSKEAPEGIVKYSWSGGSALSTGIQVGDNAFIDTSDLVGDKYVNTEYSQLSDTLIETLDLISEGLIEGPLSGKWITSGNIGQTGWSSAYFSGYIAPTGYENLTWLRSVYWNKLPVLSDAGQLNFQNVSASYTPGLPNGDILQQLTPEETTSRSIGTRLYSGDENAQVFRILNRNCKGVIINIKVPSLSHTNVTNGNIERVTLSYQIAYRPVFSQVGLQSTYSTPVKPFLFGKIVAAGGYIDSTRIDFNINTFLVDKIPFGDPIGFLNDPNFIGWEIRISRITQDSASSLLSNSTYIDSITELYGSQLSYPNSAMVRASFDSKFFTQVPERAFECNFIKVKIPANYDPIRKTYATSGYGTTNGYWNGTFASGKAWTDNPAWCFYDLITNTRYGLGKYVENIDIYKFDLYNISQYCDELVADGYGGVEPRFTCNVWIPQKEEAYKVVNDMASVFRGLVYYFNGNLNATQDSPKDARTVFTNANVENGDFNYSSTSKKTRQSVAVVRYNDPKNFYAPAIEYVENLDSIRRYGVRELPIVAFGCTSRGQAIRLGRWALYSNNTETETITFVAGLEANLLKCGDVFQVFDANRKTKRYGGRTISIDTTISGAILTLDANTDLQTGVEYSLSLLTPTFYYDQSQVTGLTSNDFSNTYRSFLQNFTFSGESTIQSGRNTIVYLNTDIDNINYNISGNPIWSIELGVNSKNYTGSIYFSDTNTDSYRVLNIKESDTNKYEVIGLLYSSEKFNQIDSGLVFQQTQVTNQSSAVTPSSPYDLHLSIENPGSIAPVIDYSFNIDSKINVTRYQIDVTTGNGIHVMGGRFKNSDGILYLPPSITQGTFRSPPVHNNPTYTFIVKAYNAVNNLYSTEFASGSINGSDGYQINSVLIGGLSIN